MTPLVLGGLALLLAGPVPGLLARSPALRRTPAAALALWQAVALAAVLAALGAGLSLLTWLVHDRIWTGWLSWVTGVIVLVLTGTVLVRLLVSGHRVGTRLRALRRQHRERVDLLARRDRDGVHVLEAAQPVAWCLPAARHGRIVVSRGLLSALPTDQAEAVLAHEREHLRARHDLVLEAFTVLHRAFPRWVASASARLEAALLVEVLADRAAARRHGPRALGAALVAVAGAAPEGTLGVGAGVGSGVGSGPGHPEGEESDLLVRVRLLARPSPPRWQAPLLLLIAIGLLALPTWLVVRPWLAALVP